MAVELILFGGLLAAVVAASREVWEAVAAVLAKRAAQTAIARRAEFDEQLRNLVIHLGGKERLGDADLETAAAIIRQSLKTELSSREFRRVDQGLSQSSRSGERRYIEDLISRSTPQHDPGLEQEVAETINEGTSGTDLTFGALPPGRNPPETLRSNGYYLLEFDH